MVLQTLCSRVGLEKIPKDISTETEYISLSDNYITNVTYGVFQNLTQIQRIILDKNYIVYIEPYSFSGLTGLIELSLQNNPLKVVDSYTFSGMLISRIIFHTILLSYLV